MSILIKQKIESNNHVPNIKSWLAQNNIDSKVGQVVIDPATFESLVTIILEDEKDLTAYYLRWGK